MRLEIADNVATVVVEHSGELLNDATELVRGKGYVLTGPWTITENEEVFTGTVRRNLRPGKV